MNERGGIFVASIVVVQKCKTARDLGAEKEDVCVLAFQGQLNPQLLLLLLLVAVVVPSPTENNEQQFLEECSEELKFRNVFNLLLLLL